MIAIVIGIIVLRLQVSVTFGCGQVYPSALMCNCFWFMSILLDKIVLILVEEVYTHCQPPIRASMQYQVVNIGGTNRK